MHYVQINNMVIDIETCSCHINIYIFFLILLDLNLFIFYIEITYFHPDLLHVNKDLYIYKSLM